MYFWAEWEKNTTFKWQQARWNDNSAGFARNKQTHLTESVIEQESRRERERTERVAKNGQKLLKKKTLHIL